jgi:uncharacterized RDD family membrane protein YckC
VSVARRPRARELQGRRAGIVSRILADAIDLGAVVVCFVLLLFAIAVVEYLVTTHPFSLPNLSSGADVLVLFGVQVLYLAAGWSGTTRTVGKEIMGLRVLRTDGHVLSFGHGLVRSLVCSLIGGPLLLWAAVSGRNAALYDHPLRTAVVYDWRSPAEILAAATAEPQPDQTQTGQTQTATPTAR